MTNIHSAKQRRRPVCPPQSSLELDTASYSPPEIVLVGFAKEREERSPDAKSRRRRHHRIQHTQDVLDAHIEPQLLSPAPATTTTTTTTTTSKRQGLAASSIPYSIRAMVGGRPVRLLVASIGNPGAYLSTRHSAGHILNKCLASHLNLPSFQKDKLYNGSISSGEDVGRPELTLWQSSSLMNVSGLGLLKAWKAFTRSCMASDSITGLVVLHDELETTPGQLKIRRGPEGSARGHNGIKSVISSLRGAAVLPDLGDRFIRIGIGIGRPISRDKNDVSAYVLGQVTREEKDGIQAQVGQVEKILQTEITRLSKEVS